MRRIAQIAVLLFAVIVCRGAHAQALLNPPCDPVPTDPVMPVAIGVPTQGCCDPLLVYQSPLDTNYFRTEIVGFQRDWQVSRTMATRENSVDPALTTHDLEFVMQPGLAVLVGHRLNPTFALEAGYVGLLQWDETRTIQNLNLNSQGTQGDLSSPFTRFGHPPEVGLDYNTFVSIRTKTAFNTAEFNLRQRFDIPPSIMQASGLYGFRYMNINDQFQYRSRSLAPPGVGADNSADVQGINNLFGAQIGGTLDFQVYPRCWLNFEGKFIIARNGATQSIDYTTGPIAGPTSTITNEQSTSRVALGGDVQASAVWKFTPHFIGELGYRAIIIDGLVLGSDSFARNAPIITTGYPEAVNTGHLVFHGPFAGMTATW